MKKVRLDFVSNGCGYSWVRFRRCFPLERHDIVPYWVWFWTIGAYEHSRLRENQDAIVLYAENAR